MGVEEHPGGNPEESLDVVKIIVQELLSLLRVDTRLDVVHGNGRENVGGGITPWLEQILVPLNFDGHERRSALPETHI